MTYLANKQRNPLPPIKIWVVKSCGQISYENTDIRLCWHYIKTNNLKTIPQSVR